MAEPKSVYDLKLHEVVQISGNEPNCTKVMRVPGGWVYRMDRDKITSCVFVPHDEFNLPGSRLRDGSQP